jgi:hypothetical protein
MAGQQDSMYCEHGRTAATCEACAHAQALADGRRASATREDLHPFPEGGALTTGFVPDGTPAPPETPTKARRRR